MPDMPLSALEMPDWYALNRAVDKVTPNAVKALQFSLKSGISGILLPQSVICPSLAVSLM